MEPSISILIATSGRVEKIRRLLESLQRTEGRDTIRHEIAVANNARDDAAASAVKALVDDFDSCGGAPCWQVREPLPGKCRAQNRTIPLTRGRIIAFLDDDVEVIPEWLQAVDGFFKAHRHDAMQGAILMRPDDRQNEELQKALQRFRTIDFLDYGYPGGADLFTLTGGNMAVKRDVFAQVGMFDERLGPGAHGISEDVEFAKRLINAGLRIGWEPRAAVYNEMDPSRLNDEEFRLRHELQGRSRLAYKNSSILTIVPNFMRAVGTFGWYSLMGNERKKYRAKGRLYHYRAMLQEKMKRMTGSQG